MNVFVLVVSCTFGLTEVIRTVCVQCLLPLSSCGYAEVFDKYLNVRRTYGTGSCEISCVEQMGTHSRRTLSLYGFDSCVCDRLRSPSHMGRSGTAVSVRCPGVETFLERLCLGQFYSLSTCDIANTSTTPAPAIRPSSSLSMIAVGTQATMKHDTTKQRKAHSTQARR